MYPEEKVPRIFLDFDFKSPSRERMTSYFSFAKSPKRSLLSFRVFASKNFEPPPRMTSTRLRYCNAMRSSWPRLMTEAAKPAGVACVILAVDTNPRRTFFFSRVSPIDSSLFPFASKLICPFGTRFPEPQAEEAAAESVTMELEDAVSMSPRTAFPPAINSHQWVPLPRT